MNNREKTVKLNPLKVLQQYRELLQLRERVREAEAALASADARKVRARDRQQSKSTD